MRENGNPHFRDSHVPPISLTTKLQKCLSGAFACAECSLTTTVLRSTRFVISWLGIAPLCNLLSRVPCCLPPTHTLGALVILFQLVRATKFIDDEMVVLIKAQRLDLASAS